VPTGPDPEAALLVSACLLGVPCNHRGEANASPAVVALGRTRRLVPVCPETMGGLPTPREPAEQRGDGSVVTEAGRDVTAAFARGADAVVALASAIEATEAVLKARSPSCGCDGVYDGTFTRTLRAGQGVAAVALIAAGVTVCSEEDVAGGPR